MTVSPDALLAEILMTPEGRSNPYPRYAAIREDSPAFRSSFGPVVVSRYEDCQWVLRDSHFGKGGTLANSNAEVWQQFGLTAQEWAERFPGFGERAPSMIALDPPDHTRLRGLVAKAFTPKTVDALRPRIQELTDECLDRCDDEVDVISALALPLPIAVISEMLGVPDEQRSELQPHVRAAVATLEPTLSLEQMEAAHHAGIEIDRHFEGLIADRRTQPTDDLLSELVHVEESGEQLSHGELLTTVFLLFAAGFETTTNLIGNGLLALLDHPDEMKRLRDDRSLMRTAVDELLRWDSPVQLDSRAVLEPVEVHGHELDPGDQVITILGSANRDPRKFDDPDRFDVARSGPQPMSFASGIHYCLGAALARAEGQIVFDRLFDRFDVIEPAWDERPSYRPAIVLHGLEQLPVHLAGRH